METTSVAMSQAVSGGAKQFVIACPAGDDLEDIIASLYFLPEHYTLVINDERAALGEVIDETLQHRIRFADDALSMDAVSFDLADVTITEDKVSAAAGHLSNNLVGHSPEAYASAILSVARATA